VRGGDSREDERKYAWDALAVEEQERAICRTKLSDLEIPDDVLACRLG
jgi:hypothetical protein